MELLKLRNAIARRKPTATVAIQKGKPMKDNEQKWQQYSYSRALISRSDVKEFLLATATLDAGISC